MDDSGRDSGAAAGVAPAGASRRRPFRHVRLERSLSPRHQPQQPPEEADGAARAGRDRPQRKAHAAGSRGRAVRQRPPRPRAARHQQPPAQVAVRHAQGQAGPLPPEPARQARGLFGPFGHRRRPGTETAPVRLAEEDGARAFQAVHLSPARSRGPLHHHQAGQGNGRAAGIDRLGHSRGCDSRASGAAQPRSHAAPPRHSGFRTDARRRQGHPNSPARLHRVQRGLRRRPDGRAHSAVARSAGGSFRADAQLAQHSFAGQRLSARRSDAGHGSRHLLPDQGQAGGQGRRPRIRIKRRSRHGARSRRSRIAHADPHALHRRSD